MNKTPKWDPQASSSLGDAEKALLPTNGRSIKKQYSERKLTYSLEDIICFKKFMKGTKTTAAFFLLLVADCIWLYFLLIQLFPASILPLQFYAILDFLLLSCVRSGLLSSCL